MPTTTAPHPPGARIVVRDVEWVGHRVDLSPGDAAIEPVHYQLDPAHRDAMTIEGEPQISVAAVLAGED